jgi:hypothetical protein
MKKFAMLLIAISATLFTIGCENKPAAPKPEGTPPAAEKAGEKPAEPAAPAEKPAEPAK